MIFYYHQCTSQCLGTSGAHWISIGLSGGGDTVVEERKFSVEASSMEEHGISREYHGNSMGKWGLVITMWNFCASFTGNTWVSDC